MRGEADLTLALADDLDPDATGFGDAVPSVAAVGKAGLRKGPATARGAQQKAAPIGATTAWRLRPSIFLPAS
jgi:hypothetical protein